MHIGLLHFHSVWRYLALLILIYAVLNSIKAWKAKQDYINTDNKLSLFTMIALHIQLLTGLGLFFTSPLVQFSNFGDVMKDTHLRFWTVEHISIMLISIALVTIGRSKAKKAIESTSKHKKTALFYGIALFLILISIPWPFSSVARPFFSF